MLPRRPHPSSGRSLFALILCACTLWGCDGRKSAQPKSSRGQVAILNLGMGAPESPVGEGLFPLPASDSFVGLVRTLAKLEGDPDTRGVFVKLRGAEIAFAQAQEIGTSLAAIRKNRPVVCHTHDVQNSTYWLLSRGCSEIWVTASGSVPTVGIGAELSYLKGAFDKIGVEPQMLAMGKYKSGGEALTRTEPSEASLANLQNTLRDLRKEWLEGIAAEHENGRMRKQHVEDGPWSPKRAAEIGLIDRVGFEGEALAHVQELSGVDQSETVFGMGKEDRSTSPAAEIVRLLAGTERRDKAKARIAVVPAEGSITMDVSSPLSSGTGITAAAMTRTLARLRKDDAVKAIVVRMDSPGGSPLASDLIWEEMMKARAVKPVIMSIAGMAASGGYYIASGASKIVASPAAIVGSIGVFGGKIVLAKSLEKMGITHYPVPASPEEGAAARAGHLSPMTYWDEPTKERVRDTMQRIYDLFVERVAEGRGLERQHVYQTAQGEIFMARVGKERGLVDELGGLADALALARKMANIPASTPVVLEGTAESLFEALVLGPEPGAQEVEAALLRFERSRKRAAARWLLGDSVSDLKPFQSFVSPLLSGESVVTSLPYGLTLH